MSKTHYLIFDISNLLYRTFFANKSYDADDAAGMAHHTALTTLNKYYKNFQPHKIVMAFDRTSWRKEYTASEECLSKKPYKGNRRQKMTPAEKAKWEKFMEHLTDFEDMMRTHTSVICLGADRLEADDLIALFVRMHSEDKITIVSGDKDLIQLLDHPEIQLIDPATGKERTLKEWDYDANLFLYEKCLRGDLGDNVGSAYPRIRSTRIRSTYTDAFARVNMMKETWRDLNGTEFVVEQVFKENQLLMDLGCQPKDIQKAGIKEILAEKENPGTFSYFHFMRFLGKYKLKKIADQAELFTPMLSR